MRTIAERLDRILFETSRAAEYFSVPELQAQTGQPVERWGDVVEKELFDNALDECEKHGERTPQITVDVAWRADGGALLRVLDNGGGLPPDAVARTRILMRPWAMARSKRVYRFVRPLQMEVAA
jgi:DNA topoisomerase VI subunit B